MLGEHPIDVMLLAADLAAAKAFYGEKVGLEVLIENDDFLTFKCGGDSRLVITKSSTGPSGEETKASWRVEDLAFAPNDDRLVLLFLALLPANAVISFPYTKDVIMSPAAAFMALAAGVAARHLLIPATGGRVRVLALAACLLLSLTWSVRLLSLHVELRVAQHKVREEWAYVDDWIALQRLDVSDPHARALRDALRDDALITRRPAGELAWARWRVFY